MFTYSNIELKYDIIKSVVLKGRIFMADNKKKVSAITSQEEDFAAWYTDVVREAKLCEY